MTDLSIVNRHASFVNFFVAAWHVQPGWSTRRSKRTGEHSTHLNDIWERHFGCEVEADRLQYQAFDCEEPLTIVLYCLRLGMSLQTVNNSTGTDCRVHVDFAANRFRLGRQLREADGIRDHEDLSWLLERIVHLRRDVQRG